MKWEFPSVFLDDGIGTEGTMGKLDCNHFIHCSYSDSQRILKRTSTSEGPE